jgi:hypothetical protein
MTARPPGPRAPSNTAGEQVIDLTEDRVVDPRMADYEQAFGLPSALHHHTLPEVVTQFRFARLRSLVTGRSRH